MILDDFYQRQYHKYSKNNQVDSFLFRRTRFRYYLQESMYVSSLQVSKLQNKKKAIEMYIYIYIFCN